MDAIELLRTDHEDIFSLLLEFEDTDTPDRVHVAAEICEALWVHAQIEEAVLYPVARSALGATGEALIDSAVIDHGALHHLIRRIRTSPPEHPLYDARLRVLASYFKRHVEEEEGELFGRLRKCGVDLIELGAELRERKVKVPRGEEWWRAPSEEALELRSEPASANRARRSG